MIYTEEIMIEEIMIEENLQSGKKEKCYYKRYFGIKYNDTKRIRRKGKK